MTLTSATAALALATAATPTVALHAPGHTPKVNTHWNYSVTVRSNGKPAAARITAQIVDPIGGVHPVEFGASTKLIKNWPFKGTFRDYVIWPPESRKITLTFRLTVKAGSTKKVIRYSVTPR
jgi:hypothetical protein